MPIPTTISSKTAACRAHANEVWKRQRIYMRRKGNRFKRVFRGKRGARARNRLVVEIADGVDKKGRRKTKRVLRAGPTYAKLMGSIPNPPATFDIQGYEAPSGNGCFIVYTAVSGGKTYELSIGKGPARKDFSHRWRELKAVTP